MTQNVAHLHEAAVQHVHRELLDLVVDLLEPCTRRRAHESNAFVTGGATVDPRRRKRALNAEHSGSKQGHQTEASAH